MSVDNDGAHPVLRTAGPYIAVGISVLAGMFAFLIRDRSEALERITAVETHQVDFDKSISKQLDEIKSDLRELRKAAENHK